MKQHVTFLVVLSCYITSFAQVNYGTPTNEPLPDKLQGLERIIEVSHFPKKVDPIKKGDTYYWMHNTALLCAEKELTIIEFGAYIFYNDTWNLRQSYPLKSLDKNFGTKNQIIAKGQPYTWSDNWRTGDTNFGGWALWFFIGKTSDGQTVCGYETIETTNNLLNK